MPTLTVEIDAAAAAQFPDLVIGGFTVSNLRAAAETIDSSGLLADAVATVTAQGLTPEQLSADPRLADWRAAFQRQGLKPSRYRTSPDALARRALRGDRVQTALPMVNAYNAISLRFLTPIGAYDLERLPGRHMTLRLARPASDTFAPLGADAASMPLLASVVVYAIGDSIMCWGFNHRDSRLACLQPHTDVAAFCSEGVTLAHHHSMLAALAALRQLLLEAGAVVSDVASTNRPGSPLVLPWPH